MAFAPTMPNTAKDVLNSMLIEFESDKTVNHLKENWFNASAPCIQQEERGEGAQLKFRDVWAFFFVYLMVGVFAIVGKIVQDFIEPADDEKEEASAAKQPKEEDKAPKDKVKTTPAPGPSNLVYSGNQPSMVMPVSMPGLMTYYP
jgi:hypothetical protein